jgi:hypothetical protein
MAIVLASAPLFADEVHLKGGGRLTGEIVEQTAESVIIDIGAGRMTVQMSTVVGIDKGTSPLQEYRSRAASIADNDVDGWRGLAQWAMKQGLEAQSDEAWSRVRKVAPDDTEANRALGLVRYEGKWVTEEESYRARGFVEFEGSWMLPAEQEAILAERRTREEADRQALAADIRASEAKRQEQEAREEAEKKARHDDLFVGNLPMLGDSSVYWGYGYGPAVWPVQPGGGQ